MEYLPQLVSLGRACQLWQTAQWPHFFPDKKQLTHFKYYQGIGVPYTMPALAALHYRSI